MKNLFVETNVYNSVFQTSSYATVETIVFYDEYCGTYFPKFEQRLPVNEGRLVANNREILFIQLIIDR